MESKVKGASILITGANGGIGIEVVKMLIKEKAQRIAPHSFETLNALFGLHMATGEMDSAEEVAKRTVEHYPQLMYAHISLAQCCTDNSAKERNHLRKAIEVNPTHFRGPFMMGLSFKRTSEFRQAIEAFEKATKLNPGYWFSRAEQAECLMELGEYQKAIEAFDDAIHYVKDYGKLYGLRGICKEKTGDDSGAKRDFGRAESLGWEGEDEK